MPTKILRDAIEQFVNKIECVEKYEWPTNNYFSVRIKKGAKFSIIFRGITEEKALDILNEYCYYFDTADPNFLTELKEMIESQDPECLEQIKKHLEMKT